MESLDILYTVLTIAIIVITICLAWFFYYAISTAHHIHQVIGRFQKTLELIENMAQTIKDKVSGSGSNLGLALSLGTKLARFFEEKANKRKVKRQKKKTTKKQEE